MAGVLREDLLDELQELKEEIEEINEQIDAFLFKADHTTDAKQLKKIEKFLSDLRKDLEADNAEMKEILAKLNEMPE